ncbi:hypothetical protein C7999DRAFT_16985 [Corynascus novoguineensis]|uniref:LrgB-like protein n=1 Tax=Corynascus novoguineensis TaxID=1126955 RepID=A0AAN7CMG6_9PEZI|nr:hypothetical protein C7999DRAFT_16985 [Corynascus novoguineensis]
MSIGFTIPVVMLSHGSVPDPRSAGMIILCFLITGLLNTIFAYFFAFTVQCLMVRYYKAFWETGRQADAEKGQEQHTPRLPTPANPLCKGSPTGSSLTMRLDCSTESSEADEPTPQHATDLQSRRSPLQDALRSWALDNPVLLLSWFLTLSIGLPLRYCSRNDVILATFLIFSTWLTTLAIQAAITRTNHLPPHLRTILSGLLNPVLCTSLAMIAYVFIDADLSHRPLSVMLDTLQTHTPLSSLLVRPANMNTTTTAVPQAPLEVKRMAAGDIATTLLNSGLVAWGLKLYAHRAHLFSRGGLAVVAVSSCLALANLAGGPLLARAALGVTSPLPVALAFAARSVTIALADPVMGILGGDGGLNAAMVVAGGIVYQIGLGLGVGRWLEAVVVEERSGTQGADGGGQVQGAKTAAVTGQQRANDPRVVAAGVTVGANAAAMGTAYLYEARSEAAPHAALSMIALGVMTVVFSSIPPLSQWVVRSVGA